MAIQRLSECQEAALLAFVEALMPSLDTDSSDPDVQAFWRHNLRNDASFVSAAKLTVEEKLSAKDRSLMFLLLTVLSSALGTSILFGTVSWRPFAELDVQTRSRYVQTLQNSSLCKRRNAFQGIKRLMLGLAFSYVDETTNQNPFWKATGFPGSPLEWQPQLDERKVQDATQRLAPLHAAFLSLPDPPDTASATISTTTLTYDIVIVGAGAGGCVAAWVLARTGYSVLVVDKGSYMEPKDIVLNEAVSLDQQYEQHGILSTTDGTVMLLAGSGVGGGTAINWSCCLPLPDYVRDEWVGLGLSSFGTKEYERSLETIMDKIGASNTDRIQHNAANSSALKGCEILDYPCQTTGQNLRDPSDPAAGYIGMGDRYANKNGGVQAFLLEAVQHGAKILPNCIVDRILTEEGPLGKRAVGVQCVVDDVRSIQIMAKKTVVLAAGALRTPCILQKKFRNKHIGKHLRLHPVTGLAGFTKPDKPPTDPIMGAPMTTVCNQFAKGEEGDGYGCKIECPVANPGLLAAAMPWASPQFFRDLLLRYRNLCLFLVLQRDHGEGSVKLARDGQSLLIDYSVSKKDRRNILEGVKGALRILSAAGMHQLNTVHIYDEGFTGENLEEYLDSVERRGTKDHEMAFFSAHQMGTCRMSDCPENGVVDECGEAWECNDLYIMDTSVFPTASGSNPMVTAHTVAHMLSTRLATALLLRDELEGHEKPRSFQGDEREQAMKRMTERLERRKGTKTVWKNPTVFKVLVPMSVAGVVVGLLWRSIVLQRDRK